MESFIKAFLGVFIFAVIVYLCTGLISAQAEVSAARNYMDNAKKEIAESHFSAAVIEEAGKKAKENGYQLTVTVYERGTGKKTVNYGVLGSGRMEDTSRAECADLVMTYPYSVPILGVKKEHCVRGYVN